MIDDGLQENWRVMIREALALVPCLSRAILYGSRANGTWRRPSDLDLALETVDGQPVPYQELLLLKAHLYSLPVPVDFDVICRASIANPELSADIERDGVLWWEREAEPPHGEPAPYRTRHTSEQ